MVTLMQWLVWCDDQSSVMFRLIWWPVWCNSQCNMTTGLVWLLVCVMASLRWCSVWFGCCLVFCITSRYNYLLSRNQCCVPASGVWQSELCDRQMIAFDKFIMCHRQSYSRDNLVWHSQMCDLNIKSHKNNYDANKIFTRLEERWKLKACTYSHTHIYACPHTQMHAHIYLHIYIHSVYIHMYFLKHTGKCI